MRDTVTTNIEFDQISLPDGTWFVADGCAHFCGDVDHDGDISDIEIEAVWLYIEPFRATGFADLRRKIEIDDSHPLWQAITGSLLTTYADTITDTLFGEAIDAGIVRRRVNGEAA